MLVQTAHEKTAPNDICWALNFHCLYSSVTHSNASRLVVAYPIAIQMFINAPTTSVNICDL